MVNYRLLEAFRGLFDGTQYNHRVSTHGDAVAVWLFEDLLTLGRSRGLVRSIERRESIVSAKNQEGGIAGRRGDGAFGTAVPGVVAVVEPGFAVPRGPIANIEIGAEVKVIGKSMKKQVNRVETDLRSHADHFRTTKANNPICVGIVGINFASRYVSYEGDRVYQTNGTGRHRHPAQEAPDTEQRLRKSLDTAFDELLLLRYKATNEPPYPFQWVDATATRMDYGAALSRISDKYENRFGRDP